MCQSTQVAFSNRSSAESCMVHARNEKPPMPALVGQPLLQVDRLSVHFSNRSSLVRQKSSIVRAVDGMSFEILRGETLGLVGESGCGKSTAGRAVLRLLRPTGGTVAFDGIDLTTLNESQIRPYRRRMQMIFQDPFSSLNPRKRVGAIVQEPMHIHRLGTRKERKAKVEELLERVGLHSRAADRYPHEFSGGQRQRVAIARALAVEPSLIVADEPVSALDVSIQAQVLNLLITLQDDLGLSYLFIGHDLAVVRHMSHRVAVAYLGKIVEVGDCTAIYTEPLHPYTEALLSAVPKPDPAVENARRRIVLRGELPDPANPPSGCRFRTRCWKAEPICSEIEPELIEHRDKHWAACHFPGS